MRKSTLRNASLRFYWRTNLAVALTSAVAVAILTGALAVGDSMRGSLRDLTLERLGTIDDAVVSETFFKDDFPARVKAAYPDSMDDSAPIIDAAMPAIILPGSMARADATAFARNVNAMGVTAQFFEQFSSAPPSRPEGVRILINQRLANELRIESGDEVILRLPKPSAIPREATLGEREDTVQSLRLEIAAVIPDEGVGRFGLQPSQQLPFNAYIDLAELQKRIDEPGRANAAFFSRKQNSIYYALLDSPLATSLTRLATLDDLGLRLTENAEPPWLQLETSRMILSPAVEKAALEAAAPVSVEPVRIYTYISNRTTFAGRLNPYSTIAAIEATPNSPFASMRDAAGQPIPPPGDNEVVLNAWIAEDLGAAPGDTIQIAYFLSGDKGELVETTTTLKVSQIAAMQGAAIDRRLTPTFPGIENADNMADWDPTFPVDLKLIRPKDEQYWDDHKAAPKMFVSLETGQRLWSSRYGNTTAIRLPLETGANATGALDRFGEKLIHKLDEANAGLQTIPVKALGLQASAGATDFGGLFIGLSLFLIVSAALLIRLVFRLGVERRAREAGLLIAVGFPLRDVRRMFLGQGLFIAAIGGIAGVLLGVGYAWFMIYGLTHWWIGAIGSPFLRLHVTAIAIGGGFIAGLLVALGAIWLALRDLAKAAPRALLAGEWSAESVSVTAAKKYKRRMIATYAFLAIAVTSAIAGFVQGAASSPAVFFAAGACLLIAGLAYASAALQRGVAGGIRPGGAAARARMGMANASRNPGRSFLIVALVASASFLIVAVGANRHAESSAHDPTPPGTGGFALVGQTDIPLYFDLNSKEARAENGFDNVAEGFLNETYFLGFRVRPGEDVSCLNLYKPQTPRILGAPTDFLREGYGAIRKSWPGDLQPWRHPFPFQSTLAETNDHDAWGQLDQTYDDGAIPAFGDANTIQWIMHLGLGKDLEIVDESGTDRKIRIAGMLKGSMLQSELVISESNFQSLYPSQGGYGFFLIKTGNDSTFIDNVSRSLEKHLAQYGFDATPSAQRLRDYKVVEEAYLSAFQTLGGLGLLLGTLGLATVLLRNIFERRAELALLWALGFNNRQIGWMIVIENTALLVAGLLLGTMSALFALAPARADALGSIPGSSLGVTLAGILVIGLMAIALITLAGLRKPSVAALRGD